MTTKTFLILTVILLAVGFAVDHRIISPGAKALAGVFFILAFIVKLDTYWSAEKPETTHPSPTSHGHGHGHSH